MRKSAPLPLLRAIALTGRQEALLEIAPELEALRAENEQLAAKAQALERCTVIPRAGSLLQRMYELERREILQAISAGNTPEETARMLKISQATLYRRAPELKKKEPRWWERERDARGMYIKRGRSSNRPLTKPG